MSELLPDKTAIAWAHRRIRELEAFVATVLDKPEDRLWHAEDNTWWMRGNRDPEDLRCVSADPPPDVAALEAERTSLIEQLGSMGLLDMKQEQEIAALLARAEKAERNHERLQRHRDQWREYAYGSREKPHDFLDGDKVDRQPTRIEALEAENAELKAINVEPGISLGQAREWKRELAEERARLDWLAQDYDPDVSGENPPDKIMSAIMLGDSVQLRAAIDAARRAG